jgi:sulfite reductase alpha subunit-like flavoprotein
MGNSEQAAQDFCSKVTQKLTPDLFQSQGLPVVTVKPTCLQLDDFLEVKHAAFTKCIVIFVSSYGVGQAPLGAYRFREVCDALSETKDQTILQGLRYAICGLGDSSYSTFMRNPTAIDAGLSAAGAQRIGTMARADANALGDESQDKTIARWMEDIWVPLAKAVAAQDPVDTKAMQTKTIPILMKLDPDYVPPKDKAKGTEIPSAFLGVAALSLLGVAIAVAVTYMN